MPDRLIVDLTDDGTAAIALAPESGPPEVLSRAPPAWPLAATVPPDLRWYLEDYLLTPFGAWEERGPAVQEEIPRWGDEVFRAVFGSEPARSAYERAWDRGLAVVVRSADPGLLRLPWELMRDSVGPVALGAGGICRNLPLPGEAGTLEVPGARLRVLMVASGPAGTDDTGYQLVAGPLVEKLTAARGELDLTILRPATFGALELAVQRAAQAGQPFHVVHFDGHGLMPAGTAGGEGALAFDQPGGGSDYAGVSKVAALLAAGQVPLTVLTASQPGAVGKELEVSAAVALLSAGCAAAVTMSYHLDAASAAEFMVAFYESLLAGDTAGQAVTAGRRRLSARDERPSPRGGLPLADWLVPVHYLRREVRFPQARTDRPAALSSLGAALDKLRAAPPGPEAPADPLAPAGAFAGRDGLLHQLEAAALAERAVLLTGPRATGKAELAKGFARWWRDTGGVDDPRLVFWHSFEHGVASFTRERMIAAVGLAAFGGLFAGLDPARQLTAVKRLLRERRALLIWDGFESVREVNDPLGATAPLDDAARAELKEFVAWVREHSASTLVITSCAAEDWLGPVRRIAVGGLNRAEAAAFASELIAPLRSAGHRREHRSFGDLLAWLDGDPSAMRLALPSLETTDPARLLSALQHASAPPGGDRLTPLDACVAHCLGQLPALSRRLLPALSLLGGIADANVLSSFSAVDGVPERFSAGEGDWGNALRDGAQAGLLTRISPQLYRIDRAVPPYLAAEWRAAGPEGYDAQRQAGEQALCIAYAGYASWIVDQLESGNAAVSIAIQLEQRSFGAALGHALARQEWTAAWPIARALDIYWSTRGLGAEADAWTERILAATTGPGQSPRAAARALWETTAGQLANRRTVAGLYDDAERLYHQVLAYLQEQPETEQLRGSLSVSYHQLGMLAVYRRRLDEADDWCRKSLAIKEKLGDRAGMARTCAQLGTTAQLRGRYDEADDWYGQSLAVWEALGDRSPMAAIYHQLGINAQQRGRLGEAETWYRKSLAISEEFGDRQVMARTCNQLGRAAQDDGRLGEAHDWFRRAAAVQEELGNRHDAAGIYLQLGVVMMTGGRPDAARDWYHRALAVSEELGDRHEVARACLALAVVTPDEEPDEAEGWYRRAYAIGEEVSDRALMANAAHDLGTISQEAGRTDEAVEWFRQFLALSEELGDRSRVASTCLRLASMAQAYGRMGEAADWARRAFAVSEELADRAMMANAAHDLGIARQESGQFDEAQEWYRRCLALEEELGDRLGVAHSYHQLGVVTQLRANALPELTPEASQWLDEADEWYRKSLAISEELGDPQGLASTYHHLGTGAHLRGQLDEATGWYRKALAVSEEHGYPVGAARTYWHLSQLAQGQGQAELAVEYRIRSIDSCRQVPGLMEQLGSGLLAELSEQLGAAALAEAWQQVTGQPLPPPLRQQITSPAAP